MKQTGLTALVSLLGPSSQQLAGFVITILAAGFLTPSEYGVYTLAIVFVELILAFTYAGFFHFIVTSDQDDDAVLSTMFWLMLGVGVVGGAALFASAGAVARLFDAPQLEPVLRLFALLQPFASVMAWGAAVLMRRTLMQRHFAIMLVQNLAALAAGAVVLVIWQSLYALVLYRFIRIALGVGLLAALTHDRPRARFDTMLARSAFGYALGLYGTRILTFCSNFGTDLLLAFYFSTAESGLYRFANRLAIGAIDIVGQPLRSFALAAFGQTARTDQSFDTVLARYFAMMVLLMGGVTATLFIFASDIIQTLFQPSYVAALGALYALALRALFSAGTAFIEPVFAARARTRIALWHSLLWTSIAVAAIFAASGYGLAVLARAQAVVALCASCAAFGLIAWQGRIHIRPALRAGAIALGLVACYALTAQLMWRILSQALSVSPLSLMLGLICALVLGALTLFAGARAGVFHLSVFKT